jgi:hypothetical protein
MEYASNLKYVLILFELMSGLKINFHKSEIFCFGNAIEKSDFYSKILPTPLENYPLVIRFIKSPNGPKWKKILKKTWDLTRKIP